jgi:hypothetical protein
MRETGERLTQRQTATDVRKRSKDGQPDRSDSKGRGGRKRGDAHVVRRFSFTLSFSPDVPVSFGVGLGGAGGFEPGVFVRGVIDDLMMKGKVGVGCIKQGKKGKMGRGDGRRKGQAGRRG